MEEKKTSTCKQKKINRKATWKTWTKSMLLTVGIMECAAKILLNSAKIWVP